MASSERNVFAVPRLLAPLALLLLAAVPALPAGAAAKEKAKAGPPAPAAPKGPLVDAARLSALKPRSIGPAIMGGRVSEIAVDPEDPATFYVGLATGGVWKTADAGGTFSPLFDDQPVASIGALAVAPSDPRVLWVGTGEANDRNSSGWGDGVYLSTDGGATWTNVGLRTSRAIARVVVHPRSAATAWVCAAGDLWAPGGERGLYRTTDSGKSWSRVPSAQGPGSETVGCGDVAADPTNPDVLYAALYARKRTPWSFEYGPAATGGKDLGGVFRSGDGGATWTRLAKGLPSLLGRIGLAVAASRPGVVMAVVQSDEGGTSGIDETRSRTGGIFRSEDGGASFARVNELNPRPFYFSQIRVDPVNDQRVYVLGYLLHVSDDGGKTFREDLFGKVHPDCHALVVTGTPRPRRPDPSSKDEPERPPVSPRLLLGTDGGVYQSFEAGQGWLHLDRIPSGQFYRANVDASTPYRICGGLQDNLNWVGPSRTYTKDGITNADWTNVSGGDGFYCVFDPSDPNVVYAESQEGYLHRFDLRTGEVEQLRPEPTEGQQAFRFHWVSPLIGSRHAKGTLYLAGNHVFRLTGRAERWTVISPDLSTKDLARMRATGSGAENYGVVYTLAESPVKAGLLWAGTDDGKLWVTEDDGGSWTDLTASLPPAVRGQWISRVEPSAHDPKVAYLAVDAHRTGNLAPLAFRTADGGRTWQPISAGLPGESPVKVLREDPKSPDLLWAGTETGLFVSLDRGASWTKVKGLPTVAVDDLVLQERESDLVVATHGRSLYVIDDVSPLRGLTAEAAAKEVLLFPPRPAFGRYLLPGWEDSNGAGVFRGENPPEGALITFHVREATGDEVKLAITNAQGQPVANLKAPGTPGLGRVAWNLRPTKDVRTEYGGLGPDKLVPAGTYTATLTYGKAKAKTDLVVTVAEGIETR